ncbi:hypothetical protein HQ520_10380 [bacterium]|nr:hypothetical protein [bacterium]
MIDEGDSSFTNFLKKEALYFVAALAQYPVDPGQAYPVGDKCAREYDLVESCLSGWSVGRFRRLLFYAFGDSLGYVKEAASQSCQISLGHFGKSGFWDEEGIPPRNGRSLGFGWNGGGQLPGARKRISKMFECCLVARIGVS